MKKFVASAAILLAIVMAFSAVSAFASSKLDEAIDELIGTKYKSGGTTTRGFDCSGFTSYVFRQLGIDLPRTSGQQSEVGTAVAKDDLREGDLVYFNTNGKGVSHIGIYVGKGKFAHSSSSKGVVISDLSDDYYVNRYMGARRVMNAETYEALSTDQK